MVETVREIRRDELSQLLDIYHVLHPADPVLDQEDAEKCWREILDDPRQKILVIDVDGRMVSSCILIIIPNLTRGGRPYALIENVVTEPSSQGKGYGTRLLKEAQRIARQAGCYKVMLMTSSKKPETLRFYGKAGFDGGEKTGFVIKFMD